jgi:hypothetical protein
MPRSGATFRALCGAGVYHHPTDTFNPDSPRACPRCKAKTTHP